jgi:hypothetical protein
MWILLAFIGGYVLGGVTALVILSLTVAARTSDRGQVSGAHGARKKDAEATRM